MEELVYMEWIHAIASLQFARNVYSISLEEAADVGRRKHWNKQVYRAVKKFSLQSTLITIVFLATQSN